MPVMTTQEGIKEIKNNMKNIDEWKKINELIPKNYKIQQDLKIPD